MSEEGLRARVKGLIGSAWAQRFVRASVYACLASAVVSLALPNSYTSEAVILPSDPNGGSLGALAGAAATFGINLPGGQNSPDQSFEAIIGSRWMGEALLTRTYEYKQELFHFGPVRSYKTTLLEALDAKNIDLGLIALQKIMKTDRDLKSNVLTLDVETKSPQLSFQITQQALTLLEEFLKEHNQTVGGEKAKFTTERLKEAEAAYNATERQLRDFLAVNRNFAQSQDPDIQIKGARLQSDLQLRRQVMTTLALNLEQSLLDQKNDTPILNAVDHGNLPVEKTNPHRALIVLVGTIVVGILAFGIEKRDKIRAFMSNIEEQPR